MNDRVGPGLTTKAPSPEMRAAQDRMLAEASAPPRITLIDRVNQTLWPDCAVCAGWRGVVLGVVLTHVSYWIIL